MLIERRLADARRHDFQQNGRQRWTAATGEAREATAESHLCECRAGQGQDSRTDCRMFSNSNFHRALCWGPRKVKVIATGAENANFAT